MRYDPRIEPLVRESERKLVGFVGGAKSSARELLLSTEDRVSEDGVRKSSDTVGVYNGNCSKECIC
jgi:hypothetical protein